jgi:hypothetical protein
MSKHVHTPIDKCRSTNRGFDESRGVQVICTFSHNRKSNGRSRAGADTAAVEEVGDKISLAVHRCTGISSLQVSKVRDALL